MGNFCYYTFCSIIFVCSDGVKCVSAIRDGASCDSAKCDSVICDGACNKFVLRWSLPENSIRILIQLLVRMCVCFLGPYRASSHCATRNISVYILSLVFNNTWCTAWQDLHEPRHSFLCAYWEHTVLEGSLKQTVQLVFNKPVMVVPSHDLIVCTCQGCV